MNRSLNLMSEASRRRRIKSEAIRLWVGVLLATCLVIGGAGVWKMWQREDARERKAALTAQHEPVQQMRGDLDLLRARINSVEEKEALPLTIARKPPVLSLIAGVVHASKEFRGEAYLKSLAYEGGAAGIEQDPTTIVIEGLARDSSAIRRFVDHLKASGRYTEVELSETEARLLRGTATTAFEVSCRL